jgi:hypothetical protein
VRQRSGVQLHKRGGASTRLQHGAWRVLLGHARALRRGLCVVVVGGGQHHLIVLVSRGALARRHRVGARALRPHALR